MRKTLLIILLSSLLLTASACNQQKDPVPVDANLTQPQTEEQTEPIKSETEPITIGAESAVIATQPATFFTEETAPTEPVQPESVNVDALTGVWSPIRVESISSGEEVSFSEAFGSSYAQYGGALAIYEDGYFEIGMGTYNNEGNHKGVLTANGMNLSAVYTGGATDFFIYAVDENGTEEIKARQGEYYVYFER